MTHLLIDGENLKGKIKAVFAGAGKVRPVWHEYDFKKLLNQALKGIEIHRSIFYFGKIKEDPATREKSKKLIEEQRLFKTHLEKQGFDVVLAGRVRGYMEGGATGRMVFKEKGVDVKIAVDMVSWACDKVVDELIVCSSDSDLQPAISEARKRGVECVYLGLDTNPNKGLSYTTNRTILLRNSEIFDCEKISD